LAKLEGILALRLANGNRTAEIKAEGLEQLTHTLTHGLRQQPIATDDTTATATPYRLLDHAIAAQLPERDADHRHIGAFRRGKRRRHG